MQSLGLLHPIKAGIVRLSFLRDINTWQKKKDYCPSVMRQQSVLKLIEGLAILIKHFNSVSHFDSGARR